MCAIVARRGFSAGRATVGALHHNPALPRPLMSVTTGPPNQT